MATKSEWEEYFELLNNRKPTLEETELAQSNGEFNTADIASVQTPAQPANTVTYTQFQEASRLLNGQAASVAEVIAAVKAGDLTTEALSGVDVPLDEWIALQEGLNGVKPSVADVVARKEFVDKNKGLNFNDLIKDERVGKVLQKAKGLTSQAAQATQSVVNDVRRDGKFAMPSNKKNLYRLQALLIVVVSILVVVGMFAGDSYVASNGYHLNIQQAYLNGFGDEGTARGELILYFILLGISGVSGLVGALVRKLATGLSILGLLAAGFYTYEFGSIKQQAVDGGMNVQAGFNYYVPHFLGFVLVALFIWVIVVRWQEKQGLVK
ncbi:MAG TPA: hypothetical protein VGM95_00015 [Lactobacillaceae bacterium]|jgi:hypothetical protein